jgi:acetolactate synthase I/II/III large subunit
MSATDRPASTRAATTRTGGQLVVDALLAEGVTTAFGINGAHVDSIYQAALDDGLRVVDVRHEMNAGHAAEGYARVTGGLGVAVLTAGGGFTNGLTSIANAFQDRTPVLYIAGSGPLDLDQTNDLQAGIDQVAMATPVTKWAHRVTRTEQIPRLLAQAIRIATAAPRGPVLLDIPWDVLRTPVDTTKIPPTAPAEVATSGVRGPDADRILELVRTASRPVAVVGSEAARAQCANQLSELADLLDLPLLADYEGLGQIVGSPHSFGLVQSLVGLSDDQHPDLVLMLGTRFGLSTSGGSGLHIPHSATIVQVDPDARELGRLQPVTLGIAADVGTSVDVLLTHARRGEHTGDHEPWRVTLAEHLRNRTEAVAKSVERTGRIHPFEAVQAVAAAIPHGAVVVADGALTYLWLSETIAQTPLSTYLCHGYLGSMGVGLGTAIGAKSANPNVPVILVTGDGSVGYSLAEFDTMVRADLPVIVLVMNNRAWGATLHAQEIVHGPERVVNNRLENGSYAAVAEALGADGQTIIRVDDIGPAIAAALASGRPTCLDIQVELDPIPPEERVLMGQLPF